MHYARVDDAVRLGLQSMCCFLRRKPTHQLQRCEKSYEVQYTFSVITKSTEKDI